MKKLIVLFVIMAAFVFSQSWNDAVETTIPIYFNSSIDLATNKDGNHILVNYANYPTYYLRYYLVNSSGAVVRNFTFETQPVQFANIDGTNDRIYVVYKIGNQIKTRKSTDAGQSWSTDIDPLNIGNNTCNNVDISFGKDDNALHVVWATQDNGNDYETYYRRLPSSDQWDAQKTVTDYGNEVGGFPTVSKSTSRVHVSYNTGQSWDPQTNLGDSKSRDKYINSWQTPQLVFTPQSFRERIHSGSSKLFDFYYKLETGMGQYHSDLYVKERSLSNTSWSSPVLLKTYAGVNEIVSAANSNDGKTHIVYEISEGVGYRNYNGSSWSQEEQIGSGYISPRIYSVSNDQYVVWGRIVPNQNIYKVYYRQYDAAPLAPSNLTISINSSDETVLTWSANNEPDVRIVNGKYKIYRAETDYNGNILPYQLVATINAVNGSVAVNSWIDGDALKSKVRKLYYKITAVDINQHESLFSNIVWRFGRLGKTISQDISNIEYKLFDNYPNPFNPSTKISYSIKEEGLVTLKVYDILGKEIATLVNENKPAGNYEAEFSASQLPSGMYIYKIQAGSFTDVKKMLLTK